MTAQPALFATEPTAGRVRATDPETSAIAARRPHSYRRIRALMADGQERTADQIHQELGGLRSTVHGAVSRCHLDGYLIAVGTGPSVANSPMTKYRIAS